MIFMINFSQRPTVDEKTNLDTKYRKVRNKMKNERKSTLRVEETQNHINPTTEETLKCTLMSAQMDARILLREGKFEPKWTCILDEDGEHVLECALVPVYVGDDEQFEGLEFPYLVEIVESSEGDTFRSDELDEIALRTMQAQAHLDALPWAYDDVDGDALWIAGQIS